MSKPKGSHPVNRLTAVTVRNLGPGRHADGGGLYLEVDPSGVGRRWFLRTMVAGKRRDIGLGSTAILTLAEARERARKLRLAARDGHDPVAVRDANKRRSLTFAEAARHVFNTRVLKKTKRPEAMQQWIGRLEKYAFPTIGDRQVHSIGPADILTVLEPIWLDRPETARRVRQRMALIFDWARAAGHVTANPVDGIKAGLPIQEIEVEHRAALPYADIPALWKRLAAEGGMAAAALRFAIMTAARPGEVRRAPWSEIDGDIWTIPAERMKMKREHRVPLSAAALAVLAGLTGSRAPDALVFPQERSKSGTLSENALSVVLKRLDVSATAHGFRSTFRDWAREKTAYRDDTVEAALAHRVGRNAVENAYKRTDLFDERVSLMRDWSNFVTSSSLVKQAI